MENLQPKPNIWEQNPKLKALLLVLIFVFLFSGIGLTVFAVWSNNYRQQIYEQTQAGLPLHKVKPATVVQQAASADNTITDSQTAVWKTYKNDQYGFEFQYPSGIVVGTQAPDSVLGSAKEKVPGLYVGTLVLIPLTTPNLVNAAQEYYSTYYKIANSTTRGQSSADGPSVVCENLSIKGPQAQMTLIDCGGEGGEAIYGMISGKNMKIFIDGYSRGWPEQDVSNLGKLSNEDLEKLFSTFKFTK